LTAELTGHWPLTRDCREVMELLRRKRNVAVLLEINDTDSIDGNLEILGGAKRRVLIFLCGARPPEMSGLRNSFCETVKGY